MNFSNQSIILFFVFIIYPLGAIPLVLIEIYNKKYYALYYLAFFMGLFAYLWVPSGDLHMISQDYDIVKSVEFLELISINTLDYFYLIIMYLFGVFDLNFAFIRFTLCTLSYILYFKIFKHLVSSNKYLIESKFISFISFLIFFFVIRFSGFLTGVRFTFGLSIFLFGFYSVFFKNKISGWFLIILAALTHFSLWVLLILTILSKKINFNKRNLLVFFIILFAIIFSTEAIILLISYLPIDEIIKTHLANYTTGFYATEEYETKSLLFRISRFLSYFIIYPSLIYVLFTKKDISKYSAYLVLIIVLSFLWKMNSAFSRYALVVVLVFVITYLATFKKQRNMTFFYLLFLCSSITYLASIYEVKRELSAGMQYKVLYTPTPLIFISKYDKFWVEENLTKNGGFKKLD
ncbi:MAG: EpsG family protein [Lutibacter sp.]|nr:EpsG family protein [Lutibacter sp.]